MAAQVNLLDYNRDTLEQFFLEHDEKSFRASQVLKWIYQSGVSEFEDMSNIGKALRSKLAGEAFIVAPDVLHRQISEDGTVKWLLAVDGSNGIETVYIPEAERGTLCVSSQVGCTLNCSFCSTGKQGFNRNLSVSEIIGQVWRASRELEEIRGEGIHISNVVMMGMGEPLLNFENVTKAMDLMMDDFAFSLAKKRVTLSTAGVVPMMDKLRERCPVSLAVSLHAPNDELRNELVPLNKKYPLAELIPACKRFVDGTRNKVTFEYVMLDGINDSVDHARQLARLLKGVPAKLNLIPFNPFPNTDYRCSSRMVIDRFRDIVRKSGVITITRKTRGDDIDAACGQLAGQVDDRTRRSTGQLPV